MLRHAERTRKRIEQLVSVLKSKIYPHRRPLDELIVSTPTERISYQEAQKLQYRPVNLGEQFGRFGRHFGFKVQPNCLRNGQESVLI